MSPSTTAAGRPAAAVLAGLPGSGHVAVQADLADPEAVRQLVDQACGALGGLDVLVNNAGIFTPHPITEVSYEQWQAAWQATLAVNLTGAANATWCAVRHMIGHGGGRIINVSSRGAFRGEPGQPAYGASKAGLNAFGQSLARALAPHGIAVATVAPGYVETDMAARHLAGPAGTRSVRKARSGGSPSPARSRRPWYTSRRRRPSGPAGPSSTSTARPTSGSHPAVAAPPAGVMSGPGPRGPAAYAGAGQPDPEKGNR